MLLTPLTNDALGCDQNGSGERSTEPKQGKEQLHVLN